MSALERFRELSGPILAGDESVQAAQRLEGLIIEELADSAPFEELLETLAMYAPGSAAPYVQPDELRSAITAALDEVGHRAG